MKDSDEDEQPHRPKPKAHAFTCASRCGAFSFQPNNKMKNMNELTLGQLTELLNLLSPSAKTAQPSILSEAIGKYCIVRTRNEGINFGKVVQADDTGVVIDEAQRIYYHKPADKTTSWYEGVAETGLSADSKISSEVSRKYIIEDYSLTVCSPVAIKSIKAHPAHGC